MTTRNLYALAVGAMLSGCSVMPLDMHPRAVCRDRVCMVQVSVTNCFAPDGIKAEPETARIGASTIIQWELPKGSGYTFSDDGIVMESNPDMQFERGGPIAKGRMYLLYDRYTLKAKFKYTINLQDANGRRCPPYDPWINNE